LVFLWLVGGAAGGYRNVFGRLLENRCLRSIGKISYGIYLYHNFMPLLLPNLFERLGIAFPESGSLRCILLLVTTLGAAAASWRCIERPILSWKAALAYRMQREGGAAESPRARHEPLEPCPLPLRPSYDPVLAGSEAGLPFSRAS
jgi:peptidoglycan/LPS O-acetylase OafA/YrhL